MYELIFDPKQFVNDRQSKKSVFFSEKEAPEVEPGADRFKDRSGRIRQGQLNLLSTKLFQNFLSDSLNWTKRILTKWCSNPISSDQFPGFSKGEVLTPQGFGVGALT